MCSRDLEECRNTFWNVVLCIIGRNIVRCDPPNAVVSRESLTDCSDRSELSAKMRRAGEEPAGVTSRGSEDAISRFVPAFYRWE